MYSYLSHMVGSGVLREGKPFNATSGMLPFLADLVVLLSSNSCFVVFKQML